MHVISIKFNEHWIENIMRTYIYGMCCQQRLFCKILLFPNHIKCIALALWLWRIILWKIHNTTYGSVDKTISWMIMSYCCSPNLILKALFRYNNRNDGIPAEGLVPSKILQPFNFPCIWIYFCLNFFRHWIFIIMEFWHPYKKKNNLILSFNTLKCDWSFFWRIFV